MNKKIFILSIIFIILSFSGFTQETPKTNTITEKIGNKDVTFNIPEDKELLEKYYIALIYTYIAAERKNIEYQHNLQRYININAKLRKDYNTIAKSVKETKSDFTEYTKIVNKSTVYTGVSLEYIIGINRTHVASIGFEGAIVFKRLMLNGAIPISILANPNNITSPISFGIGMRVGLLFRVK